MIAAVGALVVSSVLVFANVGLRAAGGSAVRVVLFGLSVYAYMYFRSGPGRSAEAKPVVRWLLGIAGASALIGVLGFVFQWTPLAPHAEQFIWLKGAQIRRAQGFLYDAGQYGNLCAFLLIGAAALWSRLSERLAPPWGLSLVAVVAAGGLVFSYSRSSIVNLFVALGVVGIFSLRRFSAKGLAVAAAGVVALVFGFSGASFF